MSRSIRDPHHKENKWKYENGKLYHQSVGSSHWVVAKRISFTPNRIVALAALVVSQHTGD